MIMKLLSRQLMQRSIASTGRRWLSSGEIPFQKVLAANRGEIATRIFRCVKIDVLRCPISFFIIFIDLSINLLVKSWK